MTCDSKINLNEIDNTIDVSKEAGYAYRIVMHLIQTSILDVILPLYHRSEQGCVE